VRSTLTNKTVLTYQASTDAAGVENPDGSIGYCKEAIDKYGNMLNYVEVVSKTGLITEIMNDDGGDDIWIVIKSGDPKNPSENDIDCVDAAP
jgi:hypothetical protein